MTEARLTRLASRLAGVLISTTIDTLRGKPGTTTALLGRGVDERLELTEGDNRRIRRKTDRHILPILVWVYFLQILDNTVLGYGNVFGLSTGNHLIGNDYSLVAIMNAIAQLGWQAFSSYLIIRVPSRCLMSALVFGWGASQACMAASTRRLRRPCYYKIPTGFFTAGCLPLFALITAQWYRRSEQPIRVAAWYSTNDIATVFASILSYGLGHIQSKSFHAWRIIFIFVGAITSRLLAARLRYHIGRFLYEEENAMAVERLRANQTGIGSNEFNWNWTQVWEMLCDPKSYLFFAMSLLFNIGTAVTTVFGPTLIADFCFDKYPTSLLIVPFGFLHFVSILMTSYVAAKWKYKAPILVASIVLVVIGLAMLYVESTSSHFRQPVAPGSYYLLAFLFGTNPFIVSWMVANTAGQTKMSAFYNCGSAVGNIVGPLLFSPKDNPHYIPGVRATLAVFGALIGIIVIQCCLLFSLNKTR